MKIAKLQNKIQDFAWGSSSYLPELLGYANLEQKPQAELWMGIHPLGESQVEDIINDNVQPLSQYLQDQDGKLSTGLGVETAAMYSGLPFLFKVLAAAQPLSIQAHPSKAQAEEGFSRENILGIELRAAERNYKDPNHKPEIALALTPFWALCGFRPIANIQQNFGYLVFDTTLNNNHRKLSFTDHESFFASLMSLEPQQKSSLLISARQNLSYFPSDTAKWVSNLMEFYPDDLGALAPLYLNLLHLKPGEAIYLPPGVLHAYLEGSAMELMANSDNVLRGGLTSKHQDISELMKVLTFEEFTPRVIHAQTMDLHRSYYPTFAAEFRLECWQLKPEDSALYFPYKHPVMLAFVFQGCIEIGGITLKPGQSCIIPAGSGEFTAKVSPISEKSGILYVAVAKYI